MSVSHSVVCCSLQPFSQLTISDVLLSDATDSCPVVCHLLCGFHILVIDAFPKLIHEGNASQDAVLSVRANSHHLAINGHGSGEADGIGNKMIREDSPHYYFNLPEEDLSFLFWHFTDNENKFMGLVCVHYVLYICMCACR